MRWLVFAAIAGCGRVNFDLLDELDAAPLNPWGCADQEREGLFERPLIAACRAGWTNTLDLRAPRTGTPCGDDLGPCAAPADACAIGWHVCADDGDPLDVTSKLTPLECETAGGPGDRFVAASQSCSACSGGCVVDSQCVYTPPYECRATTTMFCAEAMCCGLGCSSTNVCKGGFFPPNTLTTADLPSGNCGAMLGSSVTGVVCCADG